jgi:hypothetical protein
MRRLGVVGVGCVRVRRKVRRRRVVKCIYVIYEEFIYRIRTSF